MSDCREEVGPVIYNATRGAYEARVTLRQGREARSYACALHFPGQAEGDVVSLALIRQAREMRRNRRVPRVSRLGDFGVARIATPLPDNTPPEQPRRA